MKTLGIILAVLVVGTVAAGLYSVAICPGEVKIVDGPGSDARVKELEARVEALEKWAQKRGSRY